MPPKKKEQELQELENKQNKLLGKIQSLKAVLTGELEDKKKKEVEVKKKEEIEVEEEEEEEEEEDDEGDLAPGPNPVKDPERIKDLQRKSAATLRKELNDIIKSKLVLKIFSKSGIAANQLSDEQRIAEEKKIVANLIKIDPDKYSKYKIRSRDELQDLGKQELIDEILIAEDLANITEEEQEIGQGMTKPVETKFNQAKEYIEKMGKKMATTGDIKNLVKLFDELVELEAKQPLLFTQKKIVELGEIIEFMVGGLYKQEDEDVKISLARSFEEIAIKVDKVSAKIPENKKNAPPQILKDETRYRDIKLDNENTRSMIKQAAQERLERQKAPKVKDPVSGMEVKNPAGEVKMAPSGEMVSMGKLGSKENPILIGAEEKKEERYIPLPVVGTDYQGSKEMFVKQEQKPLEPFGGLQSQNEVEAPYLSTKSDKDIGNVRSVGFVGAMDQLAKVEDVTMEPSERSKSLKRFTNFRWVQSVQNSDLGYASPFQRMDDIDDRRRFGKCFMHANKMPKDADTQDELDKAKGFNTYSLVPSFDMSSKMQPATPLSFINSTSKFARKVTGDEMEPINQGKRNVNNDKNKLEFTTILHSDDPLRRIKDKYKNNIIC
jgi:hypothetical protein